MMRAAISTTVLAAILATGAARADVTISAKPTKHMNCAAGVCSPTAANAVLNSTDLANMLASGDVKVTTGSGATNIVVKETLSWTSTSRLTLDAIQSVEIDKPVMVTGTGAMTIATNDGGSGGDLLFNGKGNVTFWDLSSSLVINGNSYTLINDIPMLASDIAANPSGFYALANKIDAKHESFNNVPIRTEFLGTFEGLGQTISHLKIKHDMKNQEGFFAISDGIMRDIHLKQVDILSPSSQDEVGALVGLNRGSIFNASADGTVSGSATAMGGLVGFNQGSVTNSSAAVAVIGFDSAVVGGLIGSSTGLVVNSHATGAVTVGEGAAGGLVGNAASIRLSFATGAVTGGDASVVGGLAGASYQISQSYASGPVTAGSNGAVAGGLVGDGSGIENSYSTGAVHVGSQMNEIGGFAGIGNSIKTSYSLGEVGADAGSDVGGFIGKTSGHDSDSNYWDTDTSGMAQGCGRGRDCSAYVGLTTEQFQAGLLAGFDPAIWAENPSINSGYPYLINNPPQ